jgi:hypothetical protein
MMPLGTIPGRLVRQATIYSMAAIAARDCWDTGVMC